MSERPAAINIVIVGVGGQGTLLASRILGGLALALGYDVKVSEVHGMSQRGGSVITYVRMGREIHAPLIEQKGADFVLAFEELEALRALPYLKDGGAMIVNTQRINPLPVIVGAAPYPAHIPDILAGAADTAALDALALARQAGNERALNTVLIGVLAARLPFEKQMWLESVAAAVPARLRDVNLAAFELGYGKKTADN